MFSAPRSRPGFCTPPISSAPARLPAGMLLTVSVAVVPSTGGAAAAVFGDIAPGAVRPAADDLVEAVVDVGGAIRQQVAPHRAQPRPLVQQLGGRGAEVGRRGGAVQPHEAVRADPDLGRAAA